MATPCPIPQPAGALDGTFFGPNQPLPIPDLMLNELFGTARLDGETIVELQNTRCLNGLPFETLLDRLQRKYPASVWTSTRLTQRLNMGRRQGRFCHAGNGTWVLRDDMVKVNHCNQRYQGLTSAITRVPIQQTTVTSVSNGTYSGNLPACGNGTCGIPRLTALIPPVVLRNLRNRFGQSQQI
jgi:hypothetical protein